MNREELWSWHWQEFNRVFVQAEYSRWLWEAGEDHGTEYVKRQLRRRVIGL